MRILVVNLGSHVEQSFDAVSKQAKVSDLVDPVLDLNVERTRAVVADFIDRHFQVLDQVIEHDSG